MADLAALLEKEASAEIEAILGGARERASEIVAEAEREAEALVATRERQAEANRQAALVRARSSASLEAASMRLNAQQEAIQTVFREAEAQIEALRADGTRYPRILAALLKEAAEGLRGAPDAVVVNPSDEAAVRQALQEAGMNADVRTDPATVAGVRVVSGRISVENTLPARLAALRDELASEVAAALSSKEA